jgi:hypothetical protein
MGVEPSPVPKWIYFLCASIALLTLLCISLAARLRHLDLTTRAWVVLELSRRFDSQIDLDSLHVKIWPRLSVKGQGLTVHYHQRFDVAPLIYIREFDFNIGLAGLFRRVTHIDSVVLREMVITIPPRSKYEKKASPARPKTPLQNVVIDKIICDDTELFFLSGKPGKDPLDFDIHDLTLLDVGSKLPFQFHGNLTNAKPKGEIATQGQFGPWDIDQPGKTPVAGDYKFSGADLNPFPGIGGILSSTGSYHGPLDNLAVDGQTDTPDFSIDPVGRGLPLHTDFSATVDGTDGDTLLHPVRAVLGKSLIVANGSVVLVRAKQGHLITLEVIAPAARLEDLLNLAVKSDKPPMTGTVKLRTKLIIPPSKAKAIDKLFLDGDFGADDVQFTNAELREKLESLSRHALGQPTNQDAGSAVSDLKGHFHLENAKVTFTNLNFSVEGAAVTLDGSYQLHGGKLDFHGQLKLQGKLSETMTGAKSFFLKPFNPFFKKGTAGTVLPITISGTRENPVFGVSIFHKTFKRELGAQN